MGKNRLDYQDEIHKTKEPLIEDVESDLRQIIKDDTKNIEQKRQELLRLSKSIGLPQHSSDMHSIVLTYPQAFEQIQQWIQNKRNDKNTRKMVSAAWISACSALVSIVISVIAIIVSIYK